MTNLQTESQWLLPRNDVVFKLIFGQHKDILQSFLKEVLDLNGKEYQGIKLIDTNQRADPDTKLTILDLKIETGTGKLIDVEMQLLLISSLFQRVLYYLSQMLVEQLKPGQKYTELKRVISILILNEEKFHKDSLLQHRFRFADRNANLELTNLMEVNVLELPKAKRKPSIDCPLDAWMKFLAADGKEECMEAAAQNANVRDACMVLKELSADEKTRLEAEMREKAWRDEMDRLDGAMEKGREEGREQGREEGREQREQEIATNMSAGGLPPEQIARYLGMDVNAVTKILSLQ